MAVFSALLPLHIGLPGKNGCRFLGITDLIVLYAPIGIFCGRLANFVNDELWGRVTDVPWAVRFPNGGYLPRHPSQLYEAFFEGIVMFAVLNFLWRYKSVRDVTGWFRRCSLPFMGYSEF